MNIPLIGRMVDERFLNHRLRSTSLAGVIGACTAIFLFTYRFCVNQVWSWDLFTIAVTFVGIKLGAMAWYLLTD
jgi:hypothetical protein